MRLASLLPMFSLVACATVASEPATADPAEPAGVCRNDALASFVGQPRSEALGTQMLTASGAKVLRWVPKGTMVTMDFRDDRLTVYLDASNRIERAVCG